MRVLAGEEGEGGWTTTSKWKKRLEEMSYPRIFGRILASKCQHRGSGREALKEVKTA
jgi:hypothetical protein